MKIQKLLFVLIVAAQVPNVMAESKLVRHITFETTAGIQQWPESSVMELDTESKREGKSSLVMTPDNNYVAYFYQKVTAGHEYKLVFWYKVDKVPIQRCGILVNFAKKGGANGSAGSQLFSMKDFAVADNAWHEHTIKFTPPADAETCQLQLGFYRTNAVVNIDDLRLYDENAVANEAPKESVPRGTVVSKGKLIKHLDFTSEKGLAQWPSNVKIGITPADNSKDGRPSVLFTPESNYSAYFYERLEPGEYSMEFDWKADDTPISRCGMMIFFTSKGGKRGDLGTKNVPLSSFGDADGSWKHAAFRFTVPADSSACQIMMAFYRTNASVSIADLKIYKEEATADNPAGEKKENAPASPATPAPQPSAAAAPAVSGIVTTMSPLTTKRPYMPRKQSGYAFSSNIEKVAYVSAETPSMIHFIPVNPSHRPALCIAVPKGIKMLGVFRDLKLSAPAEYTQDGQNFDLYRVELGAKPDKYTFIWQAVGKFAPGAELKGYFWGEWADGKQEPQPLKIQVVSVPSVKPFEKMPVWISMPNDFFPLWPDMTTLKNSGFNHIDMWTYITLGEEAWGNKLLDQTRAKTKPVGMNEIGWIREWWWHKGREEDGKAVFIDGTETKDMLCLSYRGKWFDALIKQGKELIDRQIYFHSSDPEMYGAGDKICFCQKCKDRFKDYLAKSGGGLAYVDPATFEKEPEKYAELHKKWNEFKCFSYAEFFAEYRRAMEKYMAEKGIREPFRFIIYSTYHRSYPGFYGIKDYRDSHIYLKTLEDPAMLAKVFDYISPMIYTDVYANYGDYDMLLPWKDTIVLRQITENKAPIAPILCAGYPYVYAFDSDLNAEMLKYNMLEVIAGGGKGFGFWGECPFDAADMRSVAEVVKMLGPYEKLILSGTPGEQVTAVSKNAVVKRIESPEGSLVLVSEYSKRPLSVEIECPVDKASKVVNLSTGAVIGTITPDKPRFTVELKNERAVMFYVGL